MTDIEENSAAMLSPTPNKKATNFAGMAFVKSSNIFEKTESFDMVSSNLNFDIFHFKVMELTSYEDTKGLNECRVRFHFRHPLI